MKPQETVVLAEYDEISGLPLRLRTVTCAPGTKFIIERLHLSADHVHTKEWICKDGERDITGRVRVFREVKDPLPPPPVETPHFDELDVKLPFSPTETPLGWERGEITPKMRQAIQGDPLRKGK